MEPLRSRNYIPLGTNGFSDRSCLLWLKADSARSAESFIAAGSASGVPGTMRSFLLDCVLFGRIVLCRRDIPFSP